MATVSNLTINEETREIADAQSRQDIIELKSNLADEVSNRTNAVASLTTLINQINNTATLVVPSFSIDSNGHLIMEFEDE